MDVSADIQNAQSIAQSGAIKMPHAGKTLDATQKAAKDFEAVFISQFVGSMFEGIKTDGMFGGGQGEEMFRSMMVDNYGKQIASQGGFGLADSITRSLLQHQESQRAAEQAIQDQANGKTPDATGIATAKAGTADKAIPNTNPYLHSSLARINAATAKKETLQ
jgi:Rod binding domain-containing protein